MKRIHPETPAEWRAWLAKNYDAETGVELVKWKKRTGKPAVSNADAMDEAICFGWIDTTIRRIDDERYLQTFRKRTKNSRWSENTVSHAKRMIKAGKMTPAGMKAYEDGLQKPLFTPIPKNPETPRELRAALNKRPRLKTKFDGWAPSKRRLHIAMIVRAVKPETKEKRVEAVLEALREP